MKFMTLRDLYIQIGKNLPMYGDFPVFVRTLVADKNTDERSVYLTPINSLTFSKIGSNDITNGEQFIVALSGNRHLVIPGDRDTPVEHIEEEGND